MPSLFERLNEFLRTPVGGTLSALVFTTVIGGAVTQQYAAAQAKRVSAQATYQTVSASRKQMQTDLTKLLSERRTLIGFAVDAMLRDRPDSVVSAKFEAYEQSSLDYNTTRSSIVAGFGSNLGQVKAKMFETTLNSTITPSFARMADCVSKAHDLYVDGKPDSHDAGRKKLGRCGVVKATGRTWGYTAEIQKLQTCLGTYQDMMNQAIYVDNLVDFSKVNAGQAIGLDAAPGRSSLSGDVLDLDCKDDDYVCQKAMVEQKAGGLLADGCGQLTKGHYRNL